MAVRIIAASIDVTKIDKSKIETVNKDGKPFKNGAKYLPISIVVDDVGNEYGQTTAITLGQSKEEREAKTPKVYIGNGITVWTDAADVSQPVTPEVIEGQVEDEDDDLPF